MALQFNQSQSWVSMLKPGVHYTIAYPSYNPASVAKYAASKIGSGAFTSVDLGLYDNYQAAAKACQDDATANP